MIHHFLTLLLLSIVVNATSDASTDSRHGREVEFSARIPHPKANKGVKGFEFSIPRRLPSRKQKPCNEVEIFLVRGTNEPYPGKLAEIAEYICDVLEKSSSSSSGSSSEYSSWSDSTSDGSSSGTESYDSEDFESDSDDEYPDTHGNEKRQNRAIEVTVPKGRKEIEVKIPHPAYGIELSIPRQLLGNLPAFACGYTDVHYPADYHNHGHVYCDSAATGVVSTFLRMEKLSKRCPHTKIVGLGLGQGALVWGDVVTGSGGREGREAKEGCKPTKRDPLEKHTRVGKNLAAVALIGDPSHTAGQSYNHGSGAELNGTWPRTKLQLEILNSRGWKNTIRSWCEKGDVCANSGGNHRNKYSEDPSKYFGPASQIVTEVGDWVVERLDRLY